MCNKTDNRLARHHSLCLQIIKYISEYAISIFRHCVLCFSNSFHVLLLIAHTFS